MNWGVLWYIVFADWSVISHCTEAIQTCVNFLVGTRSFTLYVLVQFYGKSEFCENGRFSLSGSHIAILKFAIGITCLNHDEISVYTVKFTILYKTPSEKYFIGLVYSMDWLLC